jgi:diguanylate cyclase (GGDEF)-like protein
MINEKVKVLLVDDIKANLISLKAVLDNEELDIYEALDGNSALRILMKQEIDLVLLDVQMPDINGFEVAQLMKENKRTAHIPIIFVTAISKENKYIFKGYDVGAVDYLFKPINNEILRSKVRVFVRLQQQAKIIKAKTEELQDKVRQLEIAEKKLSNLARLDGLTGVYNRRAYDEIFEQNWKISIRNMSEISMLMIDIDDFKYFNDTYGHAQGDECLKSVVSAISDSVNRASDVVARYGGEEFAVILFDTGLSGASKVAENIRRNVENLNIKNNPQGSFKTVTVSIGVACMLPKIDIKREILLDRADQALYEAKESGKNKCLVYQDNIMK